MVFRIPVADRDPFASPGRACGLFVAGFAGFVLLLAGLERLGLPESWLGSLLVLGTLAAFVAIGFLARTTRALDYFVAGHRVPALYNGMAGAGSVISVASFVGVTGTLMLLGYDGLAWVLGSTGGFVLLAILIAPPLRKLGAYTVPDVLAFRYGGTPARLVGVVVLLASSFLLLTAQLYGAGLVAARLLGLPFEAAVWIGCAVVVLCTILGGMRALSATQVAQYVVLIAAYLLPIVLVSLKTTGLPMPELAYGKAIAGIAAREAQMLKDGLATAATLKPYLQPFTHMTPLNFFGLVLCLMIGTAALPHLLMRSFTTPTVRAARSSAAWSLFFVFLFFVLAPAYAAFARLGIYTDVIGKAPGALGSWLFSLGEMGLVSICGRDAVSAQAVADACQGAAGYSGVIRAQDFVIGADAVLTAMPAMAGLPFVVIALVAVGALAAALAAAGGLAFAMAGTLAHDVYCRSVVSDAPAEPRILAARVGLVLVAAVAAAMATMRPADLLTLVAWAFSLAMAGLFPALVLGIWWRRATSLGAILGMVAGFGIALFYILVTRYFPQAGVTHFGMTALADPTTGAPLVDVARAMADAKIAADIPAQATNPLQSKVGWFGLSNLAAGLPGLPLGFLVIWGVSLIGRAPPRDLQASVMESHTPRGHPVLLQRD
jgi:cation/acetate symporter